MVTIPLLATVFRLTTGPTGFRALFPWKKGCWSANTKTHLHLVPRSKNVNSQIDLAPRLQFPIYFQDRPKCVGAVVSSNEVSDSYLDVDTDYRKI